MRSDAWFAEYRNARDAATVLIGVGVIALMASLGYLIWTWAAGFGWLGWLSWYIGPATLLLGLAMTWRGLGYAKKARELRQG